MLDLNFFFLISDLVKGQMVNGESSVILLLLNY